MRWALCINCIEHTACREVAVGREKGTQHDPYWDTLTLCEPCANAIETADLATFHDRYVTAREISREEVAHRG